MSWFLGPRSWVPPVVLVLVLALALVLTLVLVLALVPSSGLGGPSACPGPGLVLAMAPVLVLVGWSWVADGWLIYAFPMGMVLNYHTGLMISRTLRIWPVLNYHTGLMIIRTLRIWPALAKLLCRFMNQHEKLDCYMTTQQNMNYAANMHADGNSQGGACVGGHDIA